MKKELTLSLISLLGLLAVSICFRQVLTFHSNGSSIFIYVVPLSFAALLLVGTFVFGVRRTIRN